MPSVKKMARKLSWWGLALLLGAGAGLLVPALSDAPGPNVSTRPQSTNNPANGEILAIYIGSSQCGYANLDSIPRLVATILTHSKLRARAKDLSFRSVGIAVDRDASAGFDHLRKTANFDELSTGGGWHNISVLKYTSGQFNGPAATPQIVIVERLQGEGSARDGGKDNHLMISKDEKLVHRATGVRALSAFASSGFRVLEDRMGVNTKKTVFGVAEVISVSGTKLGILGRSWERMVFGFDLDSHVEISVLAGR